MYEVIILFANDPISVYLFYEEKSGDTTLSTRLRLASRLHDLSVDEVNLESFSFFNCSRDENCLFCFF